MKATPADARRTARLLFPGEAVGEAALDHPAVRAASRVRPVPARLVRIAQRLRMRRAPLPLEAPALAARRAVLGADAVAPPRFLVRMDEYPHYRAVDDPARYGDEAFATWRDVMAQAGCAHLVAVVPAPCAEPLDPAATEGRELDAVEGRRLAQLRADGTALALHGYDHRTRDAHPRRHSELAGLDAAALDARLTRGERILETHAGVRPRVFVPPFNRFDAEQWPALAARYDVVCGGPENVLEIGAHPAPQWRGDAVWLPAYPPLYGTAAEVLPAAERRIAAGWGLWTPIVLHWGWEAERGWDDLRRLADRLAPYAADWDAFLAAVEASR